MNSCIICGCVKNCENYIEKVFENIKKIQTLFKETKIIISFDISSDLSLKKLCELKKNFDIEIIINKNPLTNIRTLNISNARNRIIDVIYKYYSNFDYFIMMDFDDVCSKPINIDTLKDGIINNNKWDALFFNNVNYYDFWALCFDDFQYSCWHSNNVKKLINLMNEEFKKKIKDNEEFIDCQSAFGGFGIYKTKRFNNCKYQSLIDITLFNKKNLQNIYNKYQIQYMINNNIYDCEHRYYHLNAIRQNNVHLKISKKYLFPPYIGEHIQILNK
tara:strand:- start:2656 stop:3477 length:822 start_codon:yes stop_codon:yes gene_type:complete